MAARVHAILHVPLSYAVHAAVVPGPPRDVVHAGRPTRSAHGSALAGAVLVVAELDHERGDADVLRGEGEQAVARAADEEQARVLHDRGREVGLVAVGEERAGREDGPGPKFGFEGLGARGHLDAALEHEVSKAARLGAAAEECSWRAREHIADLALHDEREQSLGAEHRGRELLHVAREEGAHGGELRGGHADLRAPQVAHAG
mmetsp:Transcript_17373/g.46908  ORF Transcript_17373/g.46908 Transcript_17373/m.46908 type:complete len:204 (-) Transcript_17373:1617-2228(-)